MCVDLSIGSETDLPRPRQRNLAVALCLAAVANALVPIVFFSDTNLFGDSSLHDRALVAIVVVAAYGIGFSLLMLNAHVGFASGYAVGTGAITTLITAVLAFATVEPAAWDWTELYSVMFALGGFAFALSSNIVFLVASIKYASAINPRQHVRGLLLGIASSVAFLFLYASLLSSLRTCSECAAVRDTCCYRTQITPRGPACSFANQDRFAPINLS